VCRHGRKRRNFGEFSPTFQSLISQLLSRVLKIHENGLNGWVSHHFKTIPLFLDAAVDEKIAAQKPKKVEISATTHSF
jgi:hypothetical protein